MFLVRRLTNFQLLLALFQIGPVTLYQVKRQLTRRVVATSSIYHFGLPFIVTLCEKTARTSS